MFVGRGELLAKIHGTGGEFCANDLSGSLGTGKTSILKRLEDHTPGPRPVRVNLEDFNPGHPGEQGDRVSLGAVQGSFLYFSALLETLLRRTCSQEALERFQADVTNARNAEVQGAKVSGLEKGMEEFEGTLHPQDLVNAWRSAKDIVADSFVFHWNAATTRGSMLLIDNVGEVADQEIGIWLGALLPRMARTTVVLTRTPEEPLFPLPANAVRVFDVANFNKGEVREYLNTAARETNKEIADIDYFARKVHEASGGHPATLGAIYELLWGSDAHPDMDPDEFLRDLHERPEEKAAALVERLVWRSDDALQRALWAAAVPRRFDARLLKHLLGKPKLSHADQKRVFKALGRFPFTEKLPPNDSRLRLHSYVRTGLLQRMQRTEPERFDALHTRAANYYYGDKLTVAGGRYGEAFIYEDPEWQRNKREWLYHRGYATSKDAQLNTLLEFTRVFLDAFWWWGCYVHFDFCDQLITDLAHLAKHWAVDVDQDAGPQLDVLHQALRRILRGYPLRSVKSQDAAWEDVRDALLTVQALCGLQGLDARLLTKDKRHVAALLLVFLAHTWRYPARERPEADQYYSRAAALFAQDKDWSEAWVAFERAELRFERDEADAIPDLWRHAAGLMQPHIVEAASVEENQEVDDQPDEELVSLLHGLRGDCCWASGDQARSAMWYGRAVLHAYLFHLVGGPPQDRSPDDYTLQFYVDIRARVLNRLFHVWKRGDQDAAVAMAIEMARAFPATHGRESNYTPDQLRGVLADGRPLPLAHTLFPRGPEVRELRSKESPFTREFNRLVEALYPQQTSDDLHDPAWP